MAEVKIYFPKAKKMVTISEGDLLPKGKESKTEYLDRKMEIERYLDKHEQGLFGRKIRCAGLMCGQCAWLQFTEEQLTSAGEGQPYCWLYGVTRQIFGDSTSERNISFDKLSCVGETDNDWLATRIAKIPAFIKGKSVRETWFKKNFPKSYKKLKKTNKDILRLKGGKLYTQKELKTMGEKEREFAEKKLEEEGRKRKKKFKTVSRLVRLDERVSLRASLVGQIFNKRQRVIRKADKQIKFYSDEYQKWVGKKFFDRLLGAISLDLTDLYDYWIAAKTVRHFSSVTNLYDVISKNLDRFGVVKYEKPPLKVLKTVQVKFYAPLIGLGVFDFKDFTTKSATRLRRYIRRKKMTVRHKLPSKLAELVLREWTSVEKYKEWRKSIPSINSDLLEALNMDSKDLLKLIRLEETGEIIIKKMPLTKRLSVLNALYTKYARPLHDAVRKELLAEKLNFDRKYLSSISDFVGSTVRVPLEKNEMVLLTAQSKNRLGEMTIEQIQKHRKSIEEDVRYSPKYKDYVDGLLVTFAELDKAFIKLKIDPVMDIDPTTGHLLKDLTGFQKMEVYEKSKKAVKEVEAKIKKLGLKSTKKMRYGPAKVEIKPLGKMTFMQKVKALELRAKRIAERKAEKEAEKAKPTEPEVEEKAKISKKALAEKERKEKLPFKRDELEMQKFNLRANINYDISGPVMDIWDIEYRKQGRDKKWKMAPPVSKRERKRTRKMVQSLLIKLGQIEGVETIAVEAKKGDWEYRMFKGFGFLPMKRSIRKKIGKVSNFSQENIGRMVLYMEG